MKWVDYREKLGVGFNDNQKFKMLSAKIQNFVNNLLGDMYVDGACLKYLMMVGEPCLDYLRPCQRLSKSFEMCKSCKELIAKYIAFCNTYEDPFGGLFCTCGSHPIMKKDIIKFLKDCLGELNIEFEIISDQDGIFIFPCGASELDQSLVSAPLEWLKVYPRSHVAFIKALKQYSETTSQQASDIADLFRKALETFFQEFFGGNRALENFKSDYGAYLKSQGIPKEISGNFETILQSYTLFINNYAKHRDATSDRVLEYIMYQTGNIIRLLITLKQEESNHAD